MKRDRPLLSTTQIIMLSFLVVILVGSVLLALPISTKSGESVGYLDALFTATTSTCVTGLVTLPTVTTWSWFGQIVILLLIQIGGLGVITIFAGIMIALNKRFGLKESQLIQDAFNLNSLSGLAKFVKRVILGTLIVEGIGAILYMFVFIPDYGARGIWISIFNSVSAFCNAGIDIIALITLGGKIHTCRKQSCGIRYESADKCGYGNVNYSRRVRIYCLVGRCTGIKGLETIKIEMFPKAYAA